MKTNDKHTKQGKRERHYLMNEKDFNELIEGKEIFFYQGNEIDIHIRVNPKVLEKYEVKER